MFESKQLETDALNSASNKHVWGEEQKLHWVLQHCPFCDVEFEEEQMVYPWGQLVPKSGMVQNSGKRHEPSKISWG